MALSFGSTFSKEFDQFKTLQSIDEFNESIIPFTQAMVEWVDSNHQYKNEIESWKVKLFNSEGHFLYDHQVKAVLACVNDIVLSDDNKSGYCFMPTSAGKGHILMTLSGLCVSDFQIFKLASDARADINLLEMYPQVGAVLVSLSLEYSKLIISQKKEVKRTQILVHDIEILNQIEGDCNELLGSELASFVQFKSVQAHRNEKWRENLKYVIIDECHWGNATDDVTIQNNLVEYVKSKDGRAFGFTASPYESEFGTFQGTWSHNKVTEKLGLDFNYYLDKEVIYPVTLREENLQNALPDFDGTEDSEIDIQEKEQVIKYMCKTIRDVLPTTELDGPAICFFSNIIIPDMVEELLKTTPVLKGKIKVLGSDDAKFVEVCREMFGPDIIADPEKDIKRLKDGEKIFLISRQKLLVGLNAPLLRYCFISPTNSKITIMQGIGRLMRPTKKVPKKLATLFLTSLSGKKLDISGKGSEDKPEKNDPQPEKRREDEDTPKTKYTTTSMTLSEAYDMPTKVFYKSEVGFRDFVNETFVKDGNAVEVLRKKFIDKEALDKQDDISLADKIAEVRQKCLSQYKQVILERDGYSCQGKKKFGDGYCDRPDDEVKLEIHHVSPTFAELMRVHGPDGTIEWHRNIKNLETLVTLCVDCHHKYHAEEKKKDVA